MPISSCGAVTTSVILQADLTTTASQCLKVNASNITIDGNGHSIFGSPFAILWNTSTQPSCVSIKNVSAASALQIYGEAADSNRISSSQFSKILIEMGDDNIIENSTIGSLTSDNGGSPALAIIGYQTNPAQREIVANNVIQGMLTTGEQKLVKIDTGTDGTTEANGETHCVTGGHLITGNEMVAVISGSPEPEIFWFACGSQSTISDNTMEANGLTAGMLIRDSADDNTIENNSVHIAQGNEGALIIQSGSQGYHHPRNNVFRDNRFVADAGRVLYLEALQASGNTFAHNVFFSRDSTTDSVLLNGSGNTFDHNTFYRGTAGSHVVVSGPVTLRNNVFGSYGDPSLVAAPSDYQGDYNVFFRQGGPARFKVNSTYYNGVNAWQAASGQDLHSREGDPQFVDASAGDFNIGSGSAARCAAEDGGDAGAYPYTVGGPCPPTPTFTPLPPSTPTVTPTRTPTPTRTATPSPTCVPDNGTCSGNAVGASHNGGCCSGCCYTTVPNFGGLCVSASGC